MKVNFYLKEPTSKNKTYIYCQLYHEGKKKRISLSLEIFPKEWNFSKQEMKGSSTQTHTVNNRIRTIKDKLLEIENKFIEDNKKINLDEIVQLYKQVPVRISDLYSYAEMQYNQSVYDKPKTDEYYRISLKHLRDFMDNVPVSRSFGDIDINWHKKFMKYLKGKKHKSSTRSQHNAYLRGLMRKSLEDGLHNNRSYKEFKVKKHKPPKVALSKTELESLYDLTMPTKRLEETRDIWVFAAYTGLRFSDWNRVVKLLSEHNTLSIIHKKTSTEVDIPISKIAQEILNKYNNDLPVRKYLAQRLAVKDVFQYAKDFIPSLKAEMKVRNEDDYKIVERWELCNTHTARRSFASILYRNRHNIGFGITKRDIMKLTGHESEKAFDAYIVTDDFSIHAPVSDFLSE